MSVGNKVRAIEQKLDWLSVVMINKQAVVRVSTVAKFLTCLIFFVGNVLVVRIFNFCQIVHTTIATLHVIFILLYTFWCLWFFRWCFFSNLKKYFPTFVFTFLLKRGFYHMMFQERFFLLLNETDSSGQYLTFSLNPQSCKIEL